MPIQQAVLSWVKRKNYPKGERFLKLNYPIINSTNFDMLTGSALKLLIYIASQYNGNNNGDLSAAYSGLSQRGWKSSTTLADAIDCLVHYGFIVKTRQGGKNKCNLFAVTWYEINPCHGKLDVSCTTKASHKWKDEVEKWIPKRRAKMSLKISLPTPIIKHTYPDNQTSQVLGSQ